LWLVARPPLAAARSPCPVRSRNAPAGSRKIAPGKSKEPATGHCRGIRSKNQSFKDQSENILGRCALEEIEWDPGNLSGRRVGLTVRKVGPRS
jgi:hypothetical protein